jgi:hypothetical protein
MQRQNKERLQVLDSYTLEQHFQHDVAVFENYFKKIHKANYNQLTGPNLENNALRNGLAFMKICLLLASGNLTLTDRDGQKIQKTSDIFSIATQLNHGSRIVLSGTPEKIEKILKWINNQQSVQRGNNQRAAWSTNSIIFRRTSATHDVKYEDRQLIEVKVGFWKALWKAIGNWFNNNKNTTHFGFNISLNRSGKNLEKPDGEQGHLYLHYKVHHEQLATLMFGLEPFEPASKHHSILGKSEKISAGGGLKWAALETKFGKTEHIRRKHDGAKLKLAKDFNTKHLDTILENYLNNSYKEGLASLKPQNSITKLQKQGIFIDPKVQPGLSPQLVLDTSVKLSPNNYQDYCKQNTSKAVLGQKK